jgi:hypothetical protein
MGGDTNLHNNWSYVKQMMQDSLKKSFPLMTMKNKPQNWFFKPLIRNKIEGMIVDFRLSQGNQ